jgi:hypothetical protein
VKKGFPDCKDGYSVGTLACEGRNNAETVNQRYKKYGKIYGLNVERWKLDCTQFRRPEEQASLF